MHLQLRSLLPGLSRGGSGMKTRAPGAAALQAFHGPADILEQRYGDTIVRPSSPTPSQTVPASFVAPGTASPPPPSRP